MKCFCKENRRLLSLLLSLVLLASLVPAFCLSASAYEANIAASASNIQYYPSGCVKSMDISIQAKENYAPAVGKIAVHKGPTAYGWSNRLTYDGSAWPDLTVDPTFLALGSGDEIPWTDRNIHTMTVSFDDNTIQPNGSTIYYVYLWTRSTRYGVYPDKNVATMKFDDELTFNDEVVDSTHTHKWLAKTSGNGTKAATAEIYCEGEDCDEGATISLTASDVTLPGNIFTAQISKKARAELPQGLTVSETPGYKYSSTGSGYMEINPDNFESKPGHYQASIMVMHDTGLNENLYVNYTVVNPAVTAATGDRRPIEMMVMGMAFFSALAAAAFTLDRKGFSRR